MNSLSVSQCAALLKVDEPFIHYALNKLNICTEEIPFDFLGLIFELVLFYKEQFGFLGEFDKLLTDEKCIVFYISYDRKRKRGNGWTVTDVVIKYVFISNDGTTIMIDEDSTRYTKKKNCKMELAFQDYFYVEKGHENNISIDRCLVVIPISAIFSTPPIFNPIIRRNDLLYLDYGYPSDYELVRTYDNYSLIKNRNYGYCIIDKQGYQISRYYEWIKCNNDGSIWASQQYRDWSDSFFVYYNIYGCIKTSPKFESPMEFSDGLCCVRCGETNYRNWGAINIEGDTVIDYLYNSMRGFSNGVCEVNTSDPRYTFSCGYINKEGKAVTQQGKQLISNKGETYYLAEMDRGKFKTNNYHIFSLEGEDLGYSTQGMTYDRDACNFGIANDGHVGYLNFNHEIVIPLIYKEAGRFYKGIARVVADSGQVFYINPQGQRLDVNQDFFEKLKEQVEKCEQQQFLNTTRSFSPYRSYTVHYTAWNGMKMVFSTNAKSKEDAIEQFWDSGVQYGANIDYVD